MILPRGINFGTRTYEKVSETTEPQQQTTRPKTTREREETDTTSREEPTTTKQRTTTTSGERPDTQGESQEEPPTTRARTTQISGKREMTETTAQDETKHKTPRTDDGNPPDTGGAASSSDTTIPRQIDTNETTIQRVEHVLTKRGKAIQVSVNEETTILDIADLTTMPEQHNCDEKKLREGLDEEMTSMKKTSGV